MTFTMPEVFGRADLLSFECEGIFFVPYRYTPEEFEPIDSHFWVSVDGRIYLIAPTRRVYREPITI